MKWLVRLLNRPHTKRSFRPEWESILTENVTGAKFLSVDERQRLRDFVAVFVAEKRWEGLGGLEMTDEVRVTISAQVGLLVLCLPHQYFRNVDAILVYPSTVVSTDQNRFNPDSHADREGTPILGQAQVRGPVLLVWDAVKRNARHPRNGRDVVFHEFAHKLDMLDGEVDGTPPLPDTEASIRWLTVANRKLAELRSDLDGHRETFLDAYGATNETEFFAVATEAFFTRSRRMQSEEPDLV